MNIQEVEERRFASRIRAALNASAHDIAPEIAVRLAASRRMAVSRKKAEVLQTLPALAPALSRSSPDGTSSRDPRFVPRLMQRFGLFIVLGVLALTMAGVYKLQEQQRIDELADVDSAMLLDDLPPAAYADHGFHLFLKRAE